MSDKPIKTFWGKYAFLSNFYPCKIEYDGDSYPCVENAFQAAKTLDKAQRLPFCHYDDPMDAKRAGRKLKLRDDWRDIRIQVMLELLRCKFSDPELKKQLLDTGDAHLEEGNVHKDKFWDTVFGEGENHLGKLLMQVREEISVAENSNK